MNIAFAWEISPTLSGGFGQYDTSENSFEINHMLKNTSRRVVSKLLFSISSRNIFLNFAFAWEISLTLADGFGHYDTSENNHKLEKYFKESC